MLAFEQGMKVSKKYLGMNDNFTLKFKEEKEILNKDSKEDGNTTRSSHESSNSEIIERGNRKIIISKRNNDLYQEKPYNTTRPRQKSSQKHKKGYYKKINYETSVTETSFTSEQLPTYNLKRHRKKRDLRNNTKYTIRLANTNERIEYEAERERMREGERDKQREFVSDKDLNENNKRKDQLIEQLLERLKTQEKSLLTLEQQLVLINSNQNKNNHLSHQPIQTLSEKSKNTSKFLAFLYSLFHAMFVCAFYAEFDFLGSTSDEQLKSQSYGNKEESENDFEKEEIVNKAREKEEEELLLYKENMKNLEEQNRQIMKQKQEQLEQIEKEKDHELKLIRIRSEEAIESSKKDFQKKLFEALEQEKLRLKEQNDLFLKEGFDISNIIYNY